MDADDYWLPHKVERVLEVLKQGDVGGLTHDAFYVDGTGAPLYGSEAGARTNRPPERLSFRDALFSCFIYRPRNPRPKPAGCPNSICVWREAVADFLPVPPTLELAIDGALLVGSARRGLSHLPEKLSAYRHHDHNFYVRDPKTRMYQVRLFQWAGGLPGVQAAYDKRVLQALTLENEVHSAMAEVKEPVGSMLNAVALVGRLLRLGVVPNWKNPVLPVACLLRWYGIRRALSGIRRGRQRGQNTQG